MIKYFSLHLFPIAPFLSSSFNILYHLALLRAFMYTEMYYENVSLNTQHVLHVLLNADEETKWDVKLGVLSASISWWTLKIPQSLL